MKQPLTDSEMRIVQTFWTAGQRSLEMRFRMEACGVQPYVVGTELYLPEDAL